MSIRYCARCVQCLGRGRSVYLSILPFRPFSSSFRPSTSETSKPSSSKHEPLHSPDSLDSTTALAKAREEAWYLEDDDPPISSPSPSSTQSSSPTTRQPQFTTFDPNRTSIDLPSTSVAPLPSSAPPYLVPLHTFLTSPQAGDVLDPSSVVFIDTNNMPDEMKEEGEVIKGSKEGARPNWDWIVVMVVKGHGKGVIRRAERAIRLWLRISEFEVEGQTATNKLPKVPEDTDWSIVGMPEHRICVNLFTHQGKERWDLEGIWRGQGGESRMGQEDPASM